MSSPITLSYARTVSIGERKECKLGDTTQEQYERILEGRAEPG